MAHRPPAILYRMVLPDHVCPFGVRAKEMLEGAGVAVDDRPVRIPRPRVRRPKSRGNDGTASSPPPTA